MSIYQHFRPEERGFIDQVLNWKDFVENKYAPKLTDFLDPREQQILKDDYWSANALISVFLEGHHILNANELLLYPDYYQRLKLIIMLLYLKLNIRVNSSFNTSSSSRNFNVYRLKTR